ncbi:MAG: hypothetical protein R3225_08075 [Halofilum sp. (in: g-proteobacteria)]|nr:hypothetical protein [Halofilum sp. (in: g-proteobacteria)]
MAKQKPPHQPAHGIERALCWIVIIVVSIQFVVTIVATLVSSTFELHWMYIIAPPIVILIGLGRITGRVKRGTGFGFGGR